ncbi:class I SAM-dependent methyltransferase, partial [Saccharomonospora saliphila]|uniref:class I SAM-dependent methyltransferase n=1 Tax=Saccharomonospora saliphila TaxID=369829 RepID=UPI0006949886
VTTIDFAVAAETALPLPSASVDLVHARGVLGRRPDPIAVLTEFSRVLRPGGTLAVATPDWGRVRLRPRTANVDAALRGWYQLHRRAGGDPYAGRRVDEWARRAGFRDIRSHTRYVDDYDYRGLARDVEADLAGAVRTPDGVVDQQLASAARSAWMWVRGGPGDVSRCWVETIAVR